MAAERIVTVRIRAEIGRFRADMQTAAAAAARSAAQIRASGTVAESGIGRLAQVAAGHEKAWSQVSTGLIAGGVAIVGGLTLATKAAMEWESAWTGVLKTVNGSDQELAKVESGLRGLAKTLPSTHTEIAAVAESAGQLGVATKDVVGFTKTMVDLGVSTNLTAEDAATQIAQISNVMGTMRREGTVGVSRFGAALVALGNDGASTEREILAMAQRIAGAGATIGASESDVLALSNTLASMGVNAELGGGVTTRVLLKMYSAVQEGGDKVEAFAKTAGMSASEFAEAFKGSPVEAMDAVSQGLNRVKNEGGNVVAAMKEMGIKGTEETQVMLALASSGDLLSNSLALGNKAWAENSALVEEANKRYATSSSKVKIAMNGLKDSAIDAGAIFLPIVASVAEGVTAMADSFGDLPDPIQKFLVVGGALVGIAALATGGLMKLAGGAMASATAMRALALAAPGAARGIGLVAKAAGAIAAIATIGVTIGAMIPTGTTADATELSSALMGVAAGGEAAKAGAAGLDKLFTGKGGFFDGLDVKGLEHAFKIIGNRGVADNIDLILSKTLTLGIRGSSNIEFATKNFEQLDAQLSQMATNGNAEGAAKSYEYIAEAAKKAGVDQAILTEHFPQYTKALQESSAEVEKVAESSKLLGAAMGVSFPVTKEMAESLAGIGVSADGSVTALDKLIQTLFQLSDGTLDVRAANRAVEDSFRSMEESIKTNGKSLDETTAKGSANQAALDAYIGTLKQRTTAMASAVDENGDFVHSDKEVQDSLSKSYDQAIKAAGEFGIFGKEAETLARQLLGIPKGVDVKTWMDDFALKRAQEITGALDAMPSLKGVKVIVTDEGTIPLTKGQLESIKDRTVSATVTDDGTILEVQGGINNVKGKTEYLLVSDDGTVTLVQGKINGVKDGSANVNVGASGISAVESAINTAARNRTSTVSVSYNVPPVPLAPSLASKLIPRNMFGGQIPKNAAGSKLPTSGPGTDTRDGILGIAKDGTPLSWLDGGEWVINRDSSRKHDRLARMINDDDPRLEQLNGLIGLASGGRVGWSQDQSAREKRQYEAAKRELAAAKKSVSAAKKSDSKTDDKRADQRLKRAEKELDAAKSEYEDSKARTTRLKESEFDLSRDLKRGDIRESFTSGSGMSVVDRMFDESNNKDLSKRQRSNLRSLAYKTEAELLKLEKQSDKLAKSMEKATDRRDDLLSVKNDVSQGLRGEFSLSGVLDKLQTVEGSGPLNAGAFVKSAQGKAAAFKRFGGLLEKLRKKGYGSAVIQEIASMGVVEGTQVGNALLSATTGEKNALNAAYKSMDYWADQAGESVTKSMYRGGIDAAEGVIDGLESKQKAVESAFYNMGKGAEKAFRRSLDMHSPSRVMALGGSDSVDGVIVGLERKKSAMTDAFSALGDAGAAAFSPSLSVPPSAEVARYAAQPSGAAVVIDYDRLAQAMANVQVQANVRIGNKEVAQANTAGRKELRLPV